MQEITGYVVCKNGQAIKMELVEEVGAGIIYDHPITIFSDPDDANIITGSLAGLYGEDAKDYEIRKVTLIISDEIIPIDTSRWDGEGDNDDEECED